MVNVASIDVEKLPSVALAEWRNLPTQPGVYFAVASGDVLYVGQSMDMRTRWVQHQRKAQLQREFQDVRLAWLIVAPEFLAEAESALIKRFRPVLHYSPEHATPLATYPNERT